MTWTWVPVR